MIFSKLSLTLNEVVQTLLLYRLMVFWAPNARMALKLVTTGNRQRLRVPNTFGLYTMKAEGGAMIR
jgi:hypothetical protein